MNFRQNMAFTLSFRKTKNKQKQNDVSQYLFNIESYNIPATQLQLLSSLHF